MEKNLKLLAAFAIIALTFASPTVVRGMQDPSRADEQKPLSGMQLAKGVGDTLEAPLGTGSNALLKISMDLKDLRRCTEHERIDVPVRLFLTDFASSPLSYPPFNFQVKVDCDLTPLKCVFPEKPKSFDSYDQFTCWLEQGYFANQVSITYDFHVDVQKSAPSLAQQLFFLPPNGYRFIGTHVIDNPQIIPDSFEPKVSYISQRGDTNATTVTLNGTLYLDKKPYLIEDHQQIFPHPMVEEKVLKRDQTKNFYHYQWLARSEITAIVTYEEFPNNIIKGWPTAPFGQYNLVRKKPGDLKEEIDHFACLDGNTGEKVDISDGRVFLIDCEAIGNKDAEFLENILKDEAGYLYVGQYAHTKFEKEKIRQAYYREALIRHTLPTEQLYLFNGLSLSMTDSLASVLSSLELTIKEHSKANELHQHAIKIHEKLKLKSWSGYGQNGYEVRCDYCCYRNDKVQYSSSDYSHHCFPQPLDYHNNESPFIVAESEVNQKQSQILELMKQYQAILDKPHPRWEEYKKK